MTINWEEIQTKRLNNIREWYQEYYLNSDIANTVPVVGYMILWAVFNALYNLVYLPDREFKGIDREYGYEIPKISYTSSKKKIRKFAIRLSKQGALTSRILELHRDILEKFANRIPNIPQTNEDIQVECSEKNGEKESFTFRVDDFKGIASIDNRLFLEDGSVLYKYVPFDLELNQNGSFVDSEKSIKQLLFFLYQLRNNIVHGGSAFVSTKKVIANEALPILHSIVEYLFENPNVIMSVIDK